ncbi:MULTISPECIES: DUF1499 domain-containing protein [Kordiimonas]|jgi:hypothetical protein|uniref:DUF1499 domain-containing protein n=1 Tax=Kordiimonas lacus TaxID=637679 RepID=A0A1G7ATG8_9PROT|nr:MULTISPECIES: DUF1499 domain-containing protein [Kordiimonas]SDE17837.1 Protein of unknown function [Kordiimonas lacus]
MSRIFFKKGGQKPSVFATLGLITACLTLLALVIAGPIYRAGLFGDPSSDPTLFDLQFKIITVAFRLMLVAASFTFIGLLHGRFASRARTSWRGITAALLVAISAWPLGSLFYRAENAPVLHDISTAPADQLTFRTLPGRSYEVNRPSDILGSRLEPGYLKKLHAAYPGLGSTPLAGSVTDATQAAAETAKKLGWSVVAQDPGAGHVEAIYSSPWFGFRSFIVINVREKDAVAFLDIRAVSEMGHTDFGINADLIDAFTSALRTRVG